MVLWDCESVLGVAIARAVLPLWAHAINFLSLTL